MGKARMGVRQKLGLYVAGFAMLVLMVASWIGVRSERAIYLQEMQQRSLSLLRAFSIPASIAMANDDTPRLDDYVVQFAQTADEMELLYLAVLDYSGRVVSHTNPDEFGKVYDDPMTREALASVVPVTRLREEGTHEILESAVPIVSGLRWGTLKAAFSLKRMQRSIRDSRLRSLVVSVLVAAGSAIIAYFVLSLLVIRPLSRIFDMTARFGAGDLNARVSLAGDDEMGELAAQLNRMAEQLHGYTGSLEGLVEARTAELREANAKLDRLARTDVLTGLANRRHFTEQLDFEIRRGSRSRRQFALIMLDVDHFKHYNDAHGHPAGDELLKKLAILFEMNLRSTDLVARYGGEEFIVLLLDTGPEEALATARKLQQAIAAQSLPHGETQPLGRVSVSVGVAFYPLDSADAATLIDYADQALYRAKASGRNTVCAYAERPA